MWSRPHSLLVSVTLYTVGYAMCAGAQNVTTFVAGQLIYTLGNSGITFRESCLAFESNIDKAVNSLIIADITSLQWRAFVNGAINLPYVVNAFVGGFITSGINGYSVNGWRWGVSTLYCTVI
jgi:hypothetical protein